MQSNKYSLAERNVTESRESRERMCEWQEGCSREEARLEKRDGLYVRETLHGYIRPVLQTASAHLPGFIRRLKFYSL